jgi:hypothetical protein
MFRVDLLMFELFFVPLCCRPCSSNPPSVRLVLPHLAPVPSHLCSPVPEIFCSSVLSVSDPEAVKAMASWGQLRSKSVSKQRG